MFKVNRNEEAYSQIKMNHIPERVELQSDLHYFSTSSLNEGHIENSYSTQTDNGHRLSGMNLKLLLDE